MHSFAFREVAVHAIGKRMNQSTDGWGTANSTLSRRLLSDSLLCCCLQVVPPESYPALHPWASLGQMLFMNHLHGLQDLCASVRPKGKPRGKPRKRARVSVGFPQANCLSKRRPQLLSGVNILPPSSNSLCASDLRDISLPPLSFFHRDVSHNFPTFLWYFILS